MGSAVLRRLRASNLLKYYKSKFKEEMFYVRAFTLGWN